MLIDGVVSVRCYGRGRGDEQVSNTAITASINMLQIKSFNHKAIPKSTNINIIKSPVIQKADENNSVKYTK